MRTDGRTDMKELIVNFAILRKPLTMTYKMPFNIKHAATRNFFIHFFFYRVKMG